MEELSHNEWKGKTGGQTWMQHSLVFMLKIINIRFLYAIMALVIPFYMLFNHKGYLATYYFFRKRFRYSIFKSFKNVYLNHFIFGQIILDRFAIYAGQKFDIKIDGYDLFKNLEEGDKGFLMLSSHIGNYELAGYLLDAPHKQINALVFSGETKTIMENRNKIFIKHNINLVYSCEDMSHLFIINDALREGEIVSMNGDRIFGSTKYIECDFMGEKAKFPLGPFAIAVQREVSILSIFVMKESAKKYNITINQIDIQDSSNKKDCMQQLAYSFAKNLEKTIREYPTQWFNYYDFWK